MVIVGPHSKNPLVDREHFHTRTRCIYYRHEFKDLECRYDNVIMQVNVDRGEYCCIHNHLLPLRSALCIDLQTVTFMMWDYLMHVFRVSFCSCNFGADIDRSGIHGGSGSRTNNAGLTSNCN